MSFFGKNIKKIRSVKSLSQQAFADLFDLKRGTLGAYEEGRSEPKVETIIKIANYFSISIDDMLTHELTVNELLRFKGDLTTYAEDAKKEIFSVVPCITENMQNEYIEFYEKANFISGLPTIQLPVNPEKEFRGLTVTNLEMTSHDKGFYPKDIVVGEKVPISVLKKLNAGTLVFVIVGGKLIFRKLYIIKNKLVLRAEHKNIEDENFDLSEVKELWRVRYVFFKRLPEFSDNIEDQLMLMQNELQKMKERLG